MSKATPNDRTVLSLRSVSKSYGNVVAADAVSFDVAEGELLVLLGSSGCGKSTLLRLICGLDVPDSGCIQSKGRVLTDDTTLVPSEDRKISLVFQDNALFPHMTVQANVGFGIHSRVDGVRGRRVSEVLEMVRLGDVAHRYPHELSGGQQQRVALARALAPEPNLILLDEPFSDLDRSLRTALREEIRQLLKASGTSAILVTHDQEEALSLGDRVAVQNAGRVEQIGTPNSLFAQPACRFVAEFVGETDFIPGTITPNGIQTEIGVVKQHKDGPVGSEVEIAIRADDVAITPIADGNARIVSCTFTGMVNIYRLCLESGTIVHSLQPHALSLPAGTPVHASAQPGHPLAWFPLVTANTPARS